MAFHPVLRNAFSKCREKGLRLPGTRGSDNLKKGISVAQKVQVVLEDDISGGPADETVLFALDGVSYEIDLSTGNAAELREALAGYVAVARRVGGRASSGRRRAGRSSGSGAGKTAEIRAWARDNGYEVSERGRISAEVRAAYEAAH